MLHLFSRKDNNCSSLLQWHFFSLRALAFMYECLQLHINLIFINILCLLLFVCFCMCFSVFSWLILTQASLEWFSGFFFFEFGWLVVFVVVEMLYVCVFLGGRLGVLGGFGRGLWFSLFVYFNMYVYFNYFYSRKLWYAILALLDLCKKQTEQVTLTSFLDKICKIDT